MTHLDYHQVRIRRNALLEFVGLDFVRCGDFITQGVDRRTMDALRKMGFALSAFDGGYRVDPGLVRD